MRDAQFVQRVDKLAADAQSWWQRFAILALEAVIAALRKQF